VSAASVRSGWQRITAAVHHPRAPWLLATVFAAAGVVDVLRDRHLHDEGRLTHLFARMTWEHPIALFFLQKSRPPISALYAPFAAAGPLAFGIAHVIVAAIAIVLLAGIARAFDHRWPNLAALVLAASPLYFASAAAGVSNSDGVAVAILGAWLWFARDRPFLGAVVLGLVPWIRAELAPLPVALLLVCPAAQRRAVVSGLLSFPITYALLGALVHGDALWWAHYPPSLPEPMADHPLWARQDPRIGAAALSATLLALSPAWLFAVPLPTAPPERGIPPAQWAWLAFAAFEIGVLLAMPRWRAFNFDLSPRYLLGAVPALALFVSSRTGALAPAPGLRTWIVEHAALIGAAAFALHVALGGAEPAALAATAILATAIAVGRAGFGAAAGVAVAGLLCVGPWGFADGTGLSTERTSPELQEIRARLDEDPRLHHRPIFTNAPLLSAVLPGEPFGPVHYIVQADQLHEIVTLTNPSWGQREAVLQSLGRGFYGIPAFADTFTPEGIPADAVLVLVDDPRLALVMPSELWDPVLRVHTASATLRILERVDPRAAARTHSGATP
jgi:hypothetical protein